MSTQPNLIKTAYPLFQVESPEKAAQFYVDHFGFEALFTSDWYVQIRSGSSELAFMSVGHESLPKERHGVSNRVCLTLEVTDVDAAYARIKDKMDVKVTLRDEEWGQRHFLGFDPSGLLLDVVKLLEPQGE